MHEDWLELLGDLVLVALFLKMGDIFKYCGAVSWTGIWEEFNEYMAVLNTSQDMTGFINRYQSADLVRFATLSSIIFGMVVMTFNVNETSHHGATACQPEYSYSLGFDIGFLITRAFYSVLLVQVAIYIPQARPAALTDLTCRLIIIVFVALVHLVARDSHGSWVYSVINFFEISAYLCRSALAAQIDTWLSFLTTQAPGRIMLTVSHLDARLNILVMLTLGEGVIQLLIQPPSKYALWSHYLFMLGGFVVCFGLALQYFDSVPHDVSQHVLSKSMALVFVHRYVLALLYFCLFLVGVSFKILSYTYVS